MVILGTLISILLTEERKDISRSCGIFKLKHKKELYNFYKIDDGRILVIRYSKLSYISIRHHDNNKFKLFSLEIRNY